MKVEYYRRMKNVRRLGVHTILREYNLLEHQYMVTMLFLKFAPLEDIPFDMKTLDLILHHDVLEIFTGDLPYDIKKINTLVEKSWDVVEQEVAHQHPQLKPYTDDQIESQMSPEVYKLFKACDMLELWIFIREEQVLGNNNRRLGEVERRAVRILSNFGFGSITQFINDFRIENPL